jgi:hypothetical protein
MSGQYSGIWTWRSQPPPAATAELHSNSGDWPTAVTLVLSAIDLDGTESSAVFGALAAGDTISLAQAANSATYTLSGAATGNADQTWSLPVTYASGSGTGANNTAVNVSITVATPPTPPSPLHVDALTVHPAQDNINVLRIPVPALGAWGEYLRTATGQMRGYVVTIWGQKIDVAESLADLDQLLGVTETAARPAQQPLNE